MTSADFHNIYLFLTTKDNWQNAADANEDKKITTDEFCDWVQKLAWEDNLGPKPTNDIIAKFFCTMLDTDDTGVGKNNSLDENEITKAIDDIKLYENIKNALDSKIVTLSFYNDLSNLLSDTIKDWRKAINGFVCTELIDKYGVTVNTTRDDLNKKIETILETDSVFKIHGEYVGTAVKKNLESQISDWAKDVGYSLNNDSAVNAIIDTEVNEYISANKNNLDFDALKKQIEDAIQAYVDTAEGGQLRCDNNLINEIQTARLMYGLLGAVKSSRPSDYIAYEGNEKVYLNAIRGFIVNNETLKSNDQYKNNLKGISDYADKFFASEYANGLKEVAQNNNNNNTGGVNTNDDTSSIGGGGGSGGSLTWKNGSKFEMTSLDTATITTASGFPVGTKFNVMGTLYNDFYGVNVSCDANTGVLSLTADNIKTNQTCTFTVNATDASGNPIGSREITITIKPDETKTLDDTGLNKCTEKENSWFYSHKEYSKNGAATLQQADFDAMMQSIVDQVTNELDDIIKKLKKEGYNTTALDTAKTKTIDFVRLALGSISSPGNNKGDHKHEFSINGDKYKTWAEVRTDKSKLDNWSNYVAGMHVSLDGGNKKEYTEYVLNFGMVLDYFKEQYDNALEDTDTSVATDLGELKPTDNKNNNPVNWQNDPRLSDDDKKILEKGYSSISASEVHGKHNTLIQKLLNLYTSNGDEIIKKCIRMELINYLDWLVSQGGELKQAVIDTFGENYRDFINNKGITSIKTILSELEDKLSTLGVDVSDNSRS